MKKLLVLLIVVGVVLIAGAYWFNHSRSGKNGENSYTFASVEWGTLTETVSATGALKPQEVVLVSSPLSGQIASVSPDAKVNNVVKEGDLLLKLDDREAQSKLEQAKILVGLAEQDVQKAKDLRDAAELRAKKYRELVSSKVGNKRDLDAAEKDLKAATVAVNEAELKVKQAQNAQERAQLGVDLTKVRVPKQTNSPSESTSGKRRYTILARNDAVAFGQLIGPPASAQLFTLASDLSHMQVHAQVSENDIGKIRKGLAATFTVFAYSEDDTRFEGKVVEIHQVPIQMPSSLRSAVMYDTVIDVTNQRDPKTHEWKLLPGMTAAVDIILRRHEKVWKMPTAALSFQLDEHYQTEEARKKLQDWQDKPKHDDWMPVWILNKQGKPWPIFVRIGGTTKGGETGIKDSEYNEVLEWPELDPRPDPKSRDSYPQVIIGAPPVPKRGLFEQPNVKLF